MSDSRNRPPFILQLRTKGDGKRSNYNAGCAFPNKVGGLTLFLSPGVVLDHRTSEEFYINLNPPKEGAASTLGSATHTRGADADTFDGAYEEDGDDVPF